MASLTPPPEKKPDDGGGKIEKVYKVGDAYPDATSPIGVVFWVDETDKSYDATAKTSAKGKIVSLDEVRSKWSSEYIVTAATSQTDGAANTAKILALESYIAKKYAGFAWCAAKNTPAVEGINWYIPAILELKDGIYANKAILNTTLASIDGAMALWDDCHWSSTEVDGEVVKYVYFPTGIVYDGAKYLSNDIAFRAVSAF